MPRQASPATISRRSARARAAAAANPEINVGRRLRELRTERRLSIRVLAERSGLNANTFSLIENGKTSPSVSTLQQIAAALEVPITAFFETNAPKNSVAHLAASARPRLAFAHGTLEDLGAGLTHRAVEPFIVTLEPHASSGENPIVHTGFEFVFCLHGHMTYWIQELPYELGPGDSLLFESHLPHRWENGSAQPVQALLVLYPTDSRDRPTARHFTTKEPRLK